MASISDKEDQVTHEEFAKPETRSPPKHIEQGGFETDESTLPKGYFYSTFFLGSYAAIALGLWAGTAAFAYAAPILGQINADIGPDERYVWVSLVYNVCSTVWFPIVGRFGDIFGRRYIMIAGALCAVIGSVICATAHSIPVLIGGNVFLGSASAVQLSFSYLLAELLPMKYRYFGTGTLYLFSIPGSGLGSAIAYTFVTQYSVGWRGIYWFLLAINGTALVCWVAFYFPPTFEEKHKTDIESKVYWLKHFDYFGMFLFASGFVVFLMGLSWGGAIYPWDSAAVICAIVIGFIVLVCFVIWEVFGPVKQPLIPMRLFLNGRWTAAVVLLGLGAGVYYAFTIVWPQQVAVLYANGDLMYTGYLSLIVGLGFITGQVFSGLLGTSIGKMRYQCMTAFTLGGIFLGCAATVTLYNKKTQIALLYIGCAFIGWNEGISLTNSTVLVNDQRDIGVAGGTAGCVRSGISAILTAIYTTVLTNRLTKTIAIEVPPALIEAGLPATSVAGFLEALSTGTTEAFQSIPGISQRIIAAGSVAYKLANADAYRTVYLTTIAFSGPAIILTWFAPNTEGFMTGQVAATLNHQGKELEAKKLGGEGV